MKTAVVAAHVPPDLPTLVSFVLMATEKGMNFEA